MLREASRTAHLIASAVEYTGEIRWNDAMPNGQQFRQLSTAKMRALGWEPKVNLVDGLKRTVEWFMDYDFESRKHDVSF